MGRFARIAVLAALAGQIGIWAACGSSSGVTTTVFPVPASIILSPADIVSLDLGTTQPFVGTARNARGTTISEPVAFQSSNTAVLTIANNGLACAGVWDSLVTPQICTPGAIGTAVITASTKGVVSPPTTVYVHQHVDQITVAPIPGQVPVSPPCLSKGQTYNYQAFAFSRGSDVTGTVGTFTWQAQNGTVATLNVAALNNPIGLLVPGQAQLTAKIPGNTSIYASVSGVNSLPFDVDVCAVQSILLTANGTTGGTYTVKRGASVSITPTVVDTQGTTIAGVPLNWCSSQPANVNAGGNNCATNTAASVSASTPLAGGGTVIATCTPPNCNIGLAPGSNPSNPGELPPIYPQDVIRLIVTPSSSAATPGTIYAASTGCSTAKGCVSTIIPVTVPSNVLGNAISLPATPNSLLFDLQGANAYLGTDFSFFNSQGLMKVGGGSSGTSPVTEDKSVTGIVLTVSPDGKQVIVSDTKATPNQVYVVNSSNNTTLALPITGATAADFSPDSLKAYIVAGNTLYVYSAFDPLESIQLAAPANDVSFLSIGAFGYVAEKGPNAIASYTTCTDLGALDVNGNLQTVDTPGTPYFVRSLPDSTGVIVVDPPGIDLIDVSTIPVGCAAPTLQLPGGLPNVTNGPIRSFNLGQGTFIPTQFILSTDGLRAYLLTDHVGSVLVFDLSNQGASSIALTGSPLPLHASLSPDGTRLYVAANDGTIHVLDTQGGTDLLQISFPTNPQTLLGGLCTGVTFPLQSVLSITAAAESNSNTAYTYTVTSGPPIAAGATIVITGMADPGNNGTFTITTVGSDTFTVSNPNGVTASGQSGTGTVNLACNPDLVAVKP
ncbi:MAG TPA: WD40 repeat domain-containing protein [Terriglobales bacterium]|nr:WD40 repeat domain-containing protein [Terriglobales bacterium]